MKSFLFILLLPLCTFADDRLAIDRVIAGLNRWPAPAGLFTEDASSDLGRLPEAKSPSPREAGSLGLGTAAPNFGRPVLVISHEPWGEAQLIVPGMEPTASAAFLNPKISSGKIQMITSEVALVEGQWNYQEGDTRQAIPLLFVMKKVGESWRIVSARILGAR